MPISVELRHEDGELYAALDGVFLTTAHLPNYDDARYNPPRKENHP
jgi:hypothetical protein